MSRRIFFLTAARSEYDLLYPVLHATRAIATLRSEVVVAGAHLSPFHGMGIRQIEADGFPIAGRLETLLSSESWQGRALSFGALVDALTRLLAANRPDMLFIAGDREEALAGAIVANLLQVPVAHSHGGDRCVASEIDEVLRPAISKLSHFHFTATDGHRERLIRMGELPEHVFAVGAAGLDRLRDEPDVPDAELAAALGVDVAKPFFLLIQHPSPLMQPESAGDEMRALLEGILSLGHPVLCSYPNYDPGNIAIRRAIDDVRAANPALVVYHNLPRTQFVALYRRCAAIVGNSSSIVLESGFLRVPGVLVGPRQDLREIGPNVIRVGTSADEVRKACLFVTTDADFRARLATAPSLYGDGRSGPRIAAKLAELPLDAGLLRKTIPY